ncbi:hypothetical protein HELRODRAFT_172768 [Helobdella robusta]|uniref:Endonuclease/exonuclease/phosphatase domain-containing protein n=1 Tax=Helobdella robusta TaxID=6412 RepID=T1F5X0_HELRO|nr:hypothetical protein HELRODRAFT_172768 [Helobdella robusta]ESO04386.1 hypothetical protein HELRODRAFT_172768 [Helobdella robusta]
MLLKLKNVQPGLRPSCLMTDFEQAAMQAEIEKTGRFFIYHNAFGGEYRWKKRVRRISGDPVHGVAVQGHVDGLATGTSLYSVAVQGTMDGRIICRPRDWRFDTWNLGTLTGRSLEAVEELQRRMVDVAALQEIRWKGEGTRFVEAKDGRYKLWWKEDDGTRGVGVMVRKELEEKVLEERRKSNGVIVVVMVFGKVIVRVISGYAPQQSRKEEEKIGFIMMFLTRLGKRVSPYEMSASHITGQVTGYNLKHRSVEAEFSTDDVSNGSVMLRNKDVLRLTS